MSDQRIEYVVKDMANDLYASDKGRSRLIGRATRYQDYREASKRVSAPHDRIIPVRVTTVPGKREVTPLGVRVDGCEWGVECVAYQPRKNMWRDAKGGASGKPVPMKRDHAIRIRDRSPHTRRIVPLRVTEGEPTVRVEEIGCEEVVNRLVEALAGLMEITHNIHGPDGSPDHDVERANEEARAALNFCEQHGGGA